MGVALRFVGDDCLILVVGWSCLLFVWRFLGSLIAGLFGYWLFMVRVLRCCLLVVW